MAQDRDAFIKTFYEQEYQRAYRVAYRLTGSKETAEELVQDAFLLAIVQFEEVSSHPAPAAWLICTLRNFCKNEIRRQNRRGTISLEDAAPVSAPEPPLPLKEILPRQLSEEDREILIWRFEQNMTYREIADRLGVTEGACRSRVSRAVQKCRQFRDLFSGP